VLQPCLGQKLEQYKNWVGVWGSAPNERRSEACCWGAKVDGGILETVP